MIVCSPNPESLLKAALLVELKGLPAGLRTPGAQANLFAFSEETEADSFERSGLTAALSTRTGLSYDWLDHYQGRRLTLMILFNLRNLAPDSVQVIFSALAEALRFGPGHCLLGRGRSGNLFRRRSREVGTEIHRMLGLVRFSETADGTLLARPKLFHHTADLILRKFQLRYPGQRLVFLLEGGALCCEKGRLRRIELQDIPPSFLNMSDDFTALWETYYRSQYIPARKNIRLASRFVPKKYWDWLAEGQILEQEAKK